MTQLLPEGRTVQRMKDKLFGKDSVLGELILGIIAFGILVQVIGLIFFHEKVLYATGLWIGTATAIVMAVHMAYTLGIVLCLGEEKAPGKQRYYAMIRYLLAVLAVLAVFYFKIGNPLTCIAGIMGLKAGAYLQPLTHKLLRR